MGNETIERVLTKFFCSTVLIPCIILFLSTSCSKEPTGPSAELIINERTIVVDDEENLTFEGMTTSTLMFNFTDKTPGISAGDILVSKGGNSYLRKVTSIDIKGNKVVVHTVNATLTEAIVRGTIDTTIALDIGLSKANNRVSILKSADGVTITQNGIDLSGVVLFSGAIGGDSLMVTITDGLIGFEPSLDIGFKIEDSSIEEFHLFAEGDLSFDIDLATFTSGSIDYQHEINLLTLSHIAYQQIGPVPVVEVITYEFNAGFSAIAGGYGECETGFDHKTEVRVGAQYQSGKWSSVLEKNLNQNVHETIWTGPASVEVKGYIRPCISIKFYALAGPYLDIDPYMRFTGEVGSVNAYWELVSGLESNLGFDVSVLGYGIFNYSKKLFGWELVIDSDYQEVCTYAIYPTSAQFSSSVGMGSINVTTPVGCAWAAESNNSWITISSGGSGVGDGVVEYSIDENVSSEQRIGTIIIADIAFTVVQDGIFNPVLIGFYNIGSPLRVYISGNFAYVASMTSGLQILDVSNPSIPAYVGTFEAPSTVKDVVTRGSYAYLADVQLGSGLIIIDVSDPANPSMVSNYNTSNNSYSIFISGNYAYMGEGSGGLNIINISNPTNPYLVSNWDKFPIYPDVAREVFVESGYAYLTSHQDIGVLVFDVSNPSSPSLIDTLVTNRWPWEVFVVDNYAYIAKNMGMQIFDVSDPTDSRLTGEYRKINYTGLRIFVEGNYAYLVYGASNRCGVQILDVSSPADPTEVGILPTPGRAWDVFVINGNAYIADVDSGLFIFDVSDLP